MGHRYDDCADIHNLYLQPVGDKITIHRCVSNLIIKLLYTAWYIWNYINHTLYATDGTKNTDILDCICTRIKYHLVEAWKYYHIYSTSSQRSHPTPTPIPATFLLVSCNIHRLQMGSTENLQKYTPPWYRPNSPWHHHKFPDHPPQ